MHSQNISFTRITEHEKTRLRGSITALIQSVDKIAVTLLYIEASNDLPEDRRPDMSVLYSSLGVLEYLIEDTTERLYYLRDDIDKAGVVPGTEQPLKVGYKLTDDTGRGAA